MPVTVFPASHKSEACQLNSLLRNASPVEVLRICTTLKQKNGQENVSNQLTKVLASSFGAEGHTDIYPSANGFVHAAIRAYNAHHHLRIRPDDIWVAILTQFSIYINANAKEMRSKFVSHEGKVPLDLEGAICNGMEGQFADKITQVLGKSVKDISVTQWIMQRFSTTTDHDRIAAGIIMMATFQKYFSYYDASLCGLPSVTLLGTREDWVQMLDAIERLTEFGEQPSTWLSVLRPVISRFVRSFDEPTSIEIINFWQQIADYQVGGSGADYISGWLTAFCFWDERGNCTHPLLKVGSSGYCRLHLDGVGYASLDFDDVPPGWATVPLEIDWDEYGPEGAIIHKCRMLAGSVGMTPFLSQPAEGENETESPIPQHAKPSKPRQQPERSHGILQKLLSCCESSRNEADDRTQPEPAEPPVPAGKVILPPYSSGPEMPKISKTEKPVWDYERADLAIPRDKVRGVDDPPEYRLDSLQPRIGWWLWEEGTVSEVESEAYGGKK